MRSLVVVFSFVGHRSLLRCFGSGLRPLLQVLRHVTMEDSRYQPLAFCEARPLSLSSGCGSWPGRTALCAHAVLALSWSSWPGLVGPGAGCGGGGWALDCWSVSDTSGRGFGRRFGAGSFDTTPAQDGTITAKLRPKEDSDCRSFWEQRASAQIRSRQDPEGEEEPERAFQVSPKAIFAAPCQVPTDRMSAGPPRLETQ